MFALCYGIANNVKIGKYTYKKKYHECWTLIAQMGIDKPVSHWYPDRIENVSNKWKCNLSSPPGQYPANNFNCCSVKC